MTLQPFFVPSVLLFVVSIPLVLGIVPRNRYYGFRTRKTLTDDKIWYEANRFGGWAILVSCCIYFVVAILYPASGPRDSNFSLWLVHFCSFMVPLVLGLLLTLWKVKQL